MTKLSVLIVVMGYQISALASLQPFDKTEIGKSAKDDSCLATLVDELGNVEVRFALSGGKIQD